LSGRLPATRRSVGAALPAVRGGPHLPARRAAEFRPHHQTARRLRGGRGAAPPAVARERCAASGGAPGTCPSDERRQRIMTDLIRQYLNEVTSRLDRLAEAGGPIEAAIALIADAL